MSLKCVFCDKDLNKNLTIFQKHKGKVVCAKCWNDLIDKVYLHIEKQERGK